jgi:hypothetical protein
VGSGLRDETEGLNLTERRDEAPSSWLKLNVKCQNPKFKGMSNLQISKTGLTFDDLDLN